MRAGELRHRLKIQRPVQVRTGSGAFDEVFETWLEVWGAVEPLTPREIFAAAQVQSDITTRVRIRYRPGITAKMRVAWQREAGSPSIMEYFDIEGPPIEPNTVRDELWLMCRRRDAEGFRTGGTP